MIKEPRCQLCAGELVQESNVPVENHAGLAVDYLLAWVCKNCGSVWPIAACGYGFPRQWKPLWENGERSK